MLKVNTNTDSPVRPRTAKEREAAYMEEKLKKTFAAGTGRGIKRYAKGTPKKRSK